MGEGAIGFAVFLRATPTFSLPSHAYRRVGGPPP